MQFHIINNIGLKKTLTLMFLTRNFSITIPTKQKWIYQTMLTTAQLIEATATLAGLLNVYLAARASMWNWFFGIIDVCLYFIIFYTTKLYADAGLQLIYLYCQFYGLYQWRRQQMRSESISNLPRHAYITGLIAFIILDVSLIYFLKYFTDSTTVMLDALNTSISLVAQWMMIRKWLESWWLWSIANMIAIDMYFTKSLYFTCGLYVVFLLFNLYGYLHWKKSMRVNQEQMSLIKNKKAIA